MNDYHRLEDHRWNVRLSPEAAARKLLRARRFLVEDEWRFAEFDFWRQGITDAVCAIDVAISRCRSDLKF